MVILTNFVAFCILLRKTTARSGAGFRSGACACCMSLSLPRALCCTSAGHASPMHVVLLCWQAWAIFCWCSRLPIPAYLRWSNFPLQLWVHERFICHHCLGLAAGGDRDVGRE